jgi:hypothetical protein
MRAGRSTISRKAWRTRTSLNGGWSTRIVNGVNWPGRETIDLRAPPGWTWLTSESVADAYTSTWFEPTASNAAVSSSKSMIVNWSR